MTIIIVRPLLDISFKAAKMTSDEVESRLWKEKKGTHNKKHLLESLAPHREKKGELILILP